MDLILLSLYVNDLPKASEFHIHFLLMSDDLVLLMWDKNLQRLKKTLGKEIKKINRWLYYQVILN